MKIMAMTLLLSFIGTVAAWAEQAPSPASPCPDVNSKPSPPDNPSDRLAETKGVIFPPTGLDPAMEVKPPSNDGAIKVIPAPGTPGGTPKEQPK
jgi:hypothetical protein